MKLVAERPEWLPLVEQCKDQDGSTDGLPSLEAVYGPGRWRVEPARKRNDGWVWHGIYWEIGTRPLKSHRIGAFYLPADRARRFSSNPRDNKLTICFDTQGRRVMKVNPDDSNGNNDDYLTVAVEYEVIKGETVPKPVFVKLVEVQTDVPEQAA